MRWTTNVEPGWDIRLNEVIRGERYEIVPCVSRTQNIGALGGVHVPSPEWHAEHHVARAVTDEQVRVFHPKDNRRS